MNIHDTTLFPRHYSFAFSRCMAFAVVFAISMQCSTAEEKDPVTDEWGKLLGTWQLVSAMTDGKVADAEIIKKLKVVIKEGKHTVYFGEDVIEKDIPFAIDVSKNPKTTVDTLKDGKTIKGIYKLDGDTLTSCVAATDKDRPTEFVSKAGTGHTLRVFKRVNP